MRTFDLTPLRVKKENGTLTLEDILDNNDCITDLTSNSGSDFVEL